MEKCKICKNIVIDNGKTINRHTAIFDGEKWEYVCCDCADNYFCELEIKRYERHCKERNTKVNSRIINKIKQNLI